MSANTGIAWTDCTFNPWWGCQRVSPGCERCYAETFAARVGHGKRLPTIWGPASTSERKFFGDKHWAEPLKWNAAAKRAGVRRRVFCASMADVFEDREDLVAHRARLAGLIRETQSLDWLLLTKRPENADRLWAGAWADAWNGADSIGYRWAPNIWLGTTVEDQERANRRIPKLLGVDARVRFLSCEPLLEGVYLRDLPCNVGRIDGSVSTDDYFDSLTGDGIGLGGNPGPEDREAAAYPCIDWVIVGGESGSGARPFHLTWARSLVEQCKAAGVACFVKQMGADPIDGLAGCSVQFRDRRKGGDMAEWPSELRVREFPPAAVAP